MGRFRDAMDEEMRLRGLADKTRRIYLGCVHKLVAFYRRPPDQLTQEDLRGYLVHLSRVRPESFCYFNQVVNAARFFFKHVLRRDWDFRLVPFKRPPRKLPVILSQEEVAQLLDAAGSLRNRAFLETAYSAGLRVSELVHLKLSDLDSKRMMIRVDQGKGRKDRNVKLSPALLLTLREYWKQSRPQSWLFPSARGITPLPVKTAQVTFQEIRRRAHIEKHVTLHTVTASRPTSSRTASTSASSSSCSDTEASAPPSSTPTSRPTT